MSALVLPSVVTAVTVFRKGAVVTRTATLTRGDGFPEQIRLEGLPLLLDDDSLEVQLHPDGDGPGQAPVAGDVRVTLAVPEPDEQLRPPTDDELDAAKLELAQARRQGADLMLMRESLGSMAPRSRGTPEEGAAPMESPTEARLSLLALRRERLDRLRPRLEEAAERIRVAQERVQTLEERERRASNARNPRTFEARKAVVVGLLPVAEHPAEQLRLTLRYAVPGALWAPSYVLRLEPSLDRGVLELRALVGQSTGEDWSDVALTLSTANPQQWTELPELKSLRIGRRQPPVAKTGWRPPPSGTALLYADYDRLPRPPKRTPTPPPPRGAARPAGAVPPPPPKPKPAPPAPTSNRQALTQTGVITQTGVLGSGELQRFQEIAEAAADSDLAMPRRSVARAPAKAKKRAGGPPPMQASMPMASAPMAPPAMAPQAQASPDLSGFASNGFGAAAPPGAGGGGALLDEEGGAWADDAPAEAQTLTAARSLLEYGCLWLPPPDDPKRGTLRRADQARRYGQLASLPSEQIAAALRRAERDRTEAMTLEGRMPPGDHQWSTGVDGFDYAYTAQAQVSLESDGEFHGLSLRSPGVESRPRYICVPRETPDVFRVVVIRNPLDAPLLPGPVDVYVEGRFALASTLAQTPPGGRLELGLGVEQAIKVARNTGFDDESSGLLKRHQKLEHRLRITVRNNLAQSASVELRERLSVLEEGEDDIEITVGRVEPAWDEFEQEGSLEGGRAWTVDVPAGGERNLEANWSIRIPQSQELVGGNRREEG